MRCAGQYKVDAEGRRVQRTYDSVTTDYFYLGATVIAEKTGSAWTDYIFPSAALGTSFGGQRIAKQTGSSLSTATFLHTDHLGSTRVCTDSSGSSAGTCHYEPFGEVRPGTTCSVPTVYRFAGMEWDGEIGGHGLYHTWFRQYDPSQGRWLGVDPLAGSPDDPQTFNRYAYVLNDPVNLLDLYGLAPDSSCHWDSERETFACVVKDKADHVPIQLLPGQCYDVFLDGLKIGNTCNRAPGGDPAQQQKQPESYWDCVKNDGNHFSLQSGLRYITGGWLGHGWVSGVLLGNSVSGLIELGQVLGEGRGGAALKEGAKTELGQKAGDAVGWAAAKTPDVKVSVTVPVATPATAVQERSLHTMSRTVPTGQMARSSAAVVRPALQALNLIKAPIDLTVSGFSAVVCGIGR